MKDRTFVFGGMTYKVREVRGDVTIAESEEGLAYRFMTVVVEKSLAEGDQYNHEATSRLFNQEYEQ